MKELWLLAISALCFASTANADVLSTGLQNYLVNGGTITTEYQNANAWAFYYYAPPIIYGDWIIPAAVTNHYPSGGFSETGLAHVSFGNPLSAYVFVDRNDPGTDPLNVWFGDQNIMVRTYPAYNKVEATFYVNSMSGLADIEAITYLDSDNGQYSGTIVSEETLTNAGQTTFIFPASLTSLFSISEELILTPVGTGDVNTYVTVKLKPVPEPSTAALLCIGLIGLGLVHRRDDSPRPRRLPV